MTIRTPLKHVATMNGRIGWQNLRSDEFTDSGPYLVTGMHFNDSGGVDWDRCFHITKERWLMAPEIQLRPDDILVTKDGSIGKIAFIYSMPGLAALNSHLLVIRPYREAFIPRFLYYVLNSQVFTDFIAVEKRGTTFDGLTQESMGRLPMPLPPLAIQRSIVGYLDRETARIDALIAAKQRMVELLEKRFEAFAQFACIGGIGDLERRPSPSGIYGTIPSTWIETPLRHLGCEVQTGPFGSQLHAEEYVEDGWPVVNPMNLVDGRIVAVAGMKISGEKRAELSRHMLAAGDIVFGRRGEMGRAGLVGSDQIGWVCGTGSLRLRLTSVALVPAYLKLLLQISPARAYFSLSSVGSTMENLNSEIVLAFPTIVPSRTEQVAIIEHVRQSSDRKDRLVSVLRQQIILLQERRQALITAVVTGQLDIPEAT